MQKHETYRMLPSKVSQQVLKLLSSLGRKINADVNGSYNIMQKALPNVFLDNGIGDVNKMLVSFVVHPERIVVPLRTQGSRKR